MTDTLTAEPVETPAPCGATGTKRGFPHTCDRPAGHPGEHREHYRTPGPGLRYAIHFTEGNTP